MEISSTKGRAHRPLWAHLLVRLRGVGTKFAFLVVSACRVKLFPPPTRCHWNEVFKYAYVGPAHSKKKFSVRACVGFGCPCLKPPKIVTVGP